MPSAPTRTVRGESLGVARSAYRHCGARKGRPPQAGPRRYAWHRAEVLGAPGLRCRGHPVRGRAYGVAVVPPAGRGGRERHALRHEAASALVVEPRNETAREEVLPKHCYLDESDPDMVVVCREDGTSVAAFSARGATKESLLEATREDYGSLVRLSA